jgi:diguanylate cyclase (GGDEF)-like protein
VPKVFDQPNRNKLYYAVLKALKPPSPVTAYDRQRGYIRYLDELIREHHGLKQLSDRPRVEQRVETYIDTASEADLLTLIELVPLAYQMGRAESSFARTDAFYFQERLSRELREINEDLTTFLGSIGSPARFEDGKFVRDEFAIQAPSGLSKLPLRDAIENDLRDQLSHGRPVAVVFIDLDKFNLVNERLGHPGGTRCLEAIAEEIETVALGRGKAYRYGGDEFTLILPNAITSEAAATAERVCRAVRERKAGGDAVSVTVSVGVASSDGATVTTEELVRRADDAVYVSKGTGRDKVTVWTPTVQRRPGSI